MVFKKDWNLREILIHSNLCSHVTSTPGTFPCSTDRCKACPHLCADTTIRGPNGHITFRTFTCQATTWYMPSPVSLAASSMLVRLPVCFSEHLADICHNCSKPVAQHFNSAGHTIADIKVKGLNGNYMGTPFNKNAWSLTSSKEWAQCPLVA